MGNTRAVSADNIWVFDHSPDNLMKMMQGLTEALSRRGLKWKHVSLCYMASTKNV